MCDVGDRHVVESMRASGYNLGGEQSGHVVFLDHTTTGDGLITALQLLSVMVSEQKPASLLKKVMVAYPQSLLSVKIRDKKPFSEMNNVQVAIQMAETDLGHKGRVNVRYSGTEKVARVMVEGQDEKQIKKHADDIAAAIKEQIGE